MKDTKICPKCQGKDIYRIDERRSASTAGFGRRLDLGIYLALPTTYVCCSCGFMEEYLEIEKDIDKIKRYKKARPIN